MSNMSVYGEDGTYIGWVDEPLPDRPVKWVPESYLRYTQQDQETET